MKPHPINDGRFDYAYKVPGVYNASETLECFFILSNTHGETRFISQRHLRTYKLLDSDEFFVAPEAQHRNTADESAEVAKVLSIAGNGTH